MPKVFMVPVYWQTTGEVEILAEDIHDAVHRANDRVSNGEFGLDDIVNCAFVEGTITVDEDKALG